MEFKRLSDVEVIAEPTESANVLIEENGVIKKAPKTAVGGGAGGSEPDLVIGINSHIEGATIDNISIVSGSVEAVYDTFESGKFPVVEVEIIYGDSYIRMARRIPTQIVFYGDYLNIGFNSIDINGYMMYGCRIAYNSADNYALTSFDKKLVTTTNA